MIVSRRVVLPAPFRPKIATLPPASSASFTPSSTTASPYPAVTPSTRSSSDGMTLSLSISEVERADALVGGDRVRRAFGEDPPAREDRDPPREPKHQRHVVFDEKDRHRGREPVD